MNVLKPHVSLNVSNVDASVAFYEKAFGVRATKRRPGYAKFDLASPALNLTMQEAPRTGINASHFGIQVAGPDDVFEAKRAFEAAELKTFTEENTACCYAVQDKVWIEDPDGNSWEVFVVKGDADVMGSQPAKSEPATSEATCCAPACCAPSKLGNAAP
ncbi:ArsI/CadI family heavy metal resistance metalloenzyme [Sorangium atrum]|uniref:ArsI/CadI family heavy metal resistance metalloenzyme n=1 Tax=Sorangium atrum TaxID=2995308 RepID=A0ABT5C775_9BACT|nr:ArsI/CadI family heavy metal resistance metalloenzyme [Sorangium aterium]MDC0681036.1 ArsI/CadI family heavy metal resistance metalloenzyme [Sorangium aterium]